MSQTNEHVNICDEAIKAANMPESVGAAPHSSWYLGVQEKAGVCQMSASATNHPPQTWWRLRGVAGAGEFHLQLQEQNKSEGSLSNLRS